MGPVKADSRVFSPSSWALSHQGLCRPLRYHQETVLFCVPIPPANNIRAIPAQAGDPLLGQPGSPSCHSSFLV